MPASRLVASSQAGLEKFTQLVSEFDITVVDRVKHDALPRLSVIDRLRGRTCCGQHLAKIIDRLFKIREAQHDLAPM